MYQDDTCEIISPPDHPVKSYAKTFKCSIYTYHWIRRIRFRVTILCWFQTAVPLVRTVDAGLWLCLTSKTLHVRQAWLSSTSVSKNTTSFVLVGISILEFHSVLSIFSFSADVTVGLSGMFD